MSTVMLSNRRLSKYILSSTALHVAVVALVFIASYISYEKVYDSSIYTTIDVLSSQDSNSDTHQGSNQRTKQQLQTTTPALANKPTASQEVTEATQTTNPPSPTTPSHSNYRAEGSIGGFSSSVDGITSDSAITKPAKLISVIKANRTDAARKADYSGVAIVELIIDTNGDVIASTLTNNLDYGLNDVALNIARHLKFKPAEVQSRAVKSRAVLKIKFTSSD